MEEPVVGFHRRYESKDDSLRFLLAVELFAVCRILEYCAWRFVDFLVEVVLD